MRHGLSLDTVDGSRADRRSDALDGAHGDDWTGCVKVWAVSGTALDMEV